MTLRILRKKIFGEKGMILFALSIALGYQIVLMDSFINSPLILIQEISPGVTDLNVILHRCVLGVGLVLVFVVWVIFKKSPGFRDLFINRYDFGHAIRMLGDVLKMKWTETMEPIEEAINKGKEKVKDWGDQLKKR